MLAWARFSLLLVFAPSNVTQDEVRFLACLLKGWPMNASGILYHVICENLKSIDRQTQRAIKYLLLPGLVCALCALAGVPTLPSDNFIPPKWKLDSFAWRYMMNSRGGRPKSKRNQRDGECRNPPPSPDIWRRMHRPAPSPLHRILWKNNYSFILII